MRVLFPTYTETNLAMLSNLVHSLEKQADHERFAAASYGALSRWCAFKNWDGFAEFFTRQAAEEQEHADKIYDHLILRGVLPTFGPLAAPQSSFSDLLEAAKTALALEKANTQGIVSAYELAQQTSDYPAQFLMQWFITEQVEEEAWAEKMVAKVMAANCAGSLAYLDRHIVKELTEK